MICREIRRAVDDDTRERVTYVPFGEQLKGKSGEGQRKVEGGR